MSFIKLTKAQDGSSVLLNTDEICKVEQDMYNRSQSVIHMEGQCFVVTQSLTTIEKLLGGKDE